jgi:hypothetical protein
MNMIPFPLRRVRRTAKRLLILSNLRERQRFSLPPTNWINSPVPSEPLGNMLQRLARKKPVAVLVLANIVAEMLAQLEV